MLIEQLDQMTHGRAVDECLTTIIEETGLMAFYAAEDAEKGLSKTDNLEELVHAAKQFLTMRDVDHQSDLTTFLAQTVLDAGEQDDEMEDAVQMMTLHAAKGLEFPVVFLTGLEEGLFPHQMAYEEGNLEEERRLCYVGMTRAQTRLILTHTECRRMHGRDSYQRPSRFLNEIPNHLLHSVHQKPTQFTPPPSIHQNSPLQLGQMVKHPYFGEGIVLNVEGQGHNMRVHVRFQVGAKWLLFQQANLSLVS
jgi:DNA helicase-2/ATP-dependent DNA helicase PcrA